MNKFLIAISASALLMGTSSFAQSVVDGGSAGRFENNSGVRATSPGDVKNYDWAQGGRATGPRQEGNDLAFDGGVGITGDQGLPDPRFYRTPGGRETDSVDGRFEGNSGVPAIEDPRLRVRTCYTQDSFGNTFQGRTQKSATYGCRVGSRSGGCQALGCN